MEPSSKKPLAKKKWLLLAAIAAVLAAFCLWYTRPVPFQDLIPGAELPPCHQIRVHASYEREQGRQPEEYQLTITPEDPSFDPLLSLFTGQSYRRSLGNLLPRGGRIHSTQPGDFEWLVYLDYEEPITLPDGSEASGTLLHFTNFYGTLDVSVLGEDWQANTDQQEQWLWEVMEIIQSHETTNQQS